MPSFVGLTTDDRVKSLSNFRSVLEEFGNDTFPNKDFVISTTEPKRYLSGAYFESDNIALLRKDLIVGFAVCLGLEFDFIVFCRFNNQTLGMPFKREANPAEALKRHILGFIQMYGNKAFQE